MKDIVSILSTSVASHHITDGLFWVSIIIILFGGSANTTKFGGNLIAFLSLSVSSTILGVISLYANAKQLIPPVNPHCKISLCPENRREVLTEEVPRFLLKHPHRFHFQDTTEYISHIFPLHLT